MGCDRSTVTMRHPPSLARTLQRHPSRLSSRATRRPGVKHGLYTCGREVAEISSVSGPCRDVRGDTELALSIVWLYRLVFGT
jgi:hypothetical protein